METPSHFLQSFDEFSIEMMDVDFFVCKLNIIENLFNLDIKLEEIMLKYIPDALINSNSERINYHNSRAKKRKDYNITLANAKKIILFLVDLTNYNI